MFLIALTAALFGLLAPAAVLLDLKIWVASWLPWADAIDRSDILDHSDKGVHLAIFLVLGLLGQIAWRLAKQRRQLLGSLVALGLATEWLQHFIPGRSASLGDFVADMLGLLLGTFFLRRWHPPSVLQNRAH